MLDFQPIINLTRYYIVLYSLALASLVFLICYPYDNEYNAIVFCPLVFAVALSIVVYSRHSMGVGETALVICYAFRMCVLPVLCAYGNFYLEPGKSIYIKYFDSAICLMCLEVVIVFLSLKLFGNYNAQDEKANLEKKRTKPFFITIVTIAMVALASLLCLTHPQLLSYFHFITSETDAFALIDTTSSLQSMGSVYYVFVLLVIFGRPLLSFILIDYFLRKDNKIGFFLAFLVAISNILILTDRRILSLLIGVVCLLQIFFHVKEARNQKIIVLVIVVMSIVTLLYCFDDLDKSTLIARKFQRYFSGPTLTAIGIAVLESFQQSPFDFLARLFNDSILLTGLFDSIDLKDYVFFLCGNAGKSIWTPMLIGAIQYFGIAGLLFLPLIVWVVVKFDQLTYRSSSVLNIAIANYVTLSIAVYMVMYTIDLVIYNVIFVGGVYLFLLHINQNFLLDRRAAS